MKNSQVPLKLRISFFYVSVQELYQKIIRRIWYKKIVRWWRFLWIRKDDMHPSYDMDSKAILEMDDTEQAAYDEALYWKRREPHRLVDITELPEDDKQKVFKYMQQRKLKEKLF